MLLVCMMEISDQYDEIYFKFMKKNGKCFSWPTTDGQCWVPFFTTAWGMLSLHWFKEIVHIPIQFDRFNSMVLS